MVRSLEHRKEELEAELERLTQPPEEGASVGFGKRVGDGTTEAVERLSSTATARSIYRSIEDVQRAIERAREGRYGLCEACGEPIAPLRLEVLPAAVSCFDCASR